MSAPRLPKSEMYWKNKGIKPLPIWKNSEVQYTYKNVMLYFHDDLDGFSSCHITKQWLLRQGFNILGYGVINYQESFRYTTLDKEVINVCVDYSKNHDNIHCYIDHHIGEVSKDVYAIKTATGSAYEGIRLQFGLPTDELTVKYIDMIDSFRYIECDVDLKDLINFDYKRIFESKNPKLTFAGMVNQFIKRSDHNTLIEVAHNMKSTSVYEIYHCFKKFYPANNKNKDFLEDGKNRIIEMKRRTRGCSEKKVYTSQLDFCSEFYNPVNKRIELKSAGYQILGNLVFMPSGTWVNAIRARSILEEDIEKGIIKTRIDFILLQYGSTLQIVSYHNFSLLEDKDLPVLKDGTIVRSIGEYTDNLLANFKMFLGYTDPCIYLPDITEEITLSGGHKGIGSLSNLVGKVKCPNKNYIYNGVKFLDMFKNKIIQDLSSCVWNNLAIAWTEEKEFTEKKIENNHRVRLIHQIRSHHLAPKYIHSCNPQP